MKRFAERRLLISMGISYLELPFATAEFYVWAACAGFIITMFFVYFLKGAESKLMEKLLISQAFSEESARTLKELEMSGGLVKYLLRNGSTLRKVVTLVGDSRSSLQKGVKTKINFESARFYIAESNQKRAESMKKSAVKWYMLPIFCAIAIGIAVGMHYLIPFIQNW